LIGNAIDALKKKEGTRKLTIQTDFDSEENMYVRIIDNGCGIDSKNLETIFSFGFTTKGSEGHGFGLHSSNLMAKEMEGELSVASEGIGKGAVFTLKIPFSKHQTHRQEKKLSKDLELV